MRMRKKPNLPARLERCADVLTAAPETVRGHWLEVYPGCGRLYLEIGCGKGRFITQTAKDMPDTLLVGLERVPEALVVAMERTVDGGLQNIRFVDTDAARLPALFAPGEVGRIYLNFRRPMAEKKRTPKRRLTHENFLMLYKQILAPGGEIHIKTDNDGLFDFSLEQLEACGFELSAVTRDLHINGPAGVMTDYELRFHEQGVSIKQLRG